MHKKGFVILSVLVEHGNEDGKWFLGERQWDRNIKVLWGMNPNKVAPLVGEPGWLL